jgi:hypothetical protein
MKALVDGLMLVCGAQLFAQKPALTPQDYIADSAARLEVRVRDRRVHQPRLRLRRSLRAGWNVLDVAQRESPQHVRWTGSTRRSRTRRYARL